MSISGTGRWPLWRRLWGVIVLFIVSVLIVIFKGPFYVLADILDYCTGGNWSRNTRDIWRN